MFDIFLICFIFGAFSGVLAGLFGIGGGVVLVPFFVALFSLYKIGGEHIMLIAVASSLATIVITSLVASWAHYRLGALLKLPVIHLSVGMGLGVVLGAMAVDKFAVNYLQLIFGIYLLLVALQMATQYKPKQGTHHLNNSRLKVAGSFIGFVSAFLGIGGGTLTVPYLAKHNIKMKNAVAISSACGFPIALIGSISYMSLGWNALDLPEGSIGYVYLPAFFGVVLSSVFAAPLGAKLAQQLPAQVLKRYFSVLLFIIALKMLWVSF